MANPKNPVVASFPVPPPTASIAIGTTSDGKQVFWSPSGLEFMQFLWAAIQGQGGMLDLAYYAGLLTDDAGGETTDADSELNIEIAADPGVPGDGISQETLIQSLAFGSTGEAPDSGPSIPTLTIPANLLATPAVPVPAKLTAILDKTVGATRGTLLVRGAATWQALPLGASGTQLTSNGTDAVWT